jgi:DNA mismatch repair protein MutL
MDQPDVFQKLGLAIERFSSNAVLIREVPFLLKDADWKTLLRDMAHQLANEEPGTAIGQALDHLLATMACHGSIRGGKSLTLEEMNALLRQMEASPYSGQCNHGRPTYVTLGWGDVKRLFGR